MGLSFIGFSERKTHTLGACDDMAVGQHKAVSGNDHTGTDAALSSSLGDLDANDCRTDPADNRSDRSRIGVEWRLILWVADRVFIKGRQRRACWALKIEYAEPSRMRDRVGTTNSIELVKQRADVELGGVNRNAESARDLFVRGTLGKQRDNLELPRGQRNLAITQSRFCCRKHQGCISGFARTD